MSWSPTLFSGSGPVGIPTVPWTEEKKLKISHFFYGSGGRFSCRAWLNGQHSTFCFSGL
jgi:hypothetical protein